MQYENEILALKERETELLTQVSQLRNEGFENRMAAERYSYFAGVQQQDRSGLPPLS